MVMPSLPIKPPRRVWRGSRPAPWIPEVDRSTAIVDCAVYENGARRAGFPDWRGALDYLRSNETGFVWIGLHEPSERQLGGIAEAFSLHPLAVEDAVHAHQRPKLETYDESLFVVVKTVHHNPSADGTDIGVVETGEVMIFLGEQFVITVRHGEHGALNKLRKRLEDAPTLLSMGPSVVLHAVLDQVVDEYLAVTNELQSDIDEAEVSVFSGMNGAEDANRLYGLKREVLAMKRSAAPLTGPLRMLAHRPMRFVSEDSTEYFRDVDDHLTQVVEQIAAFDDLLTTLVSANLARVSVIQNEDMRKISSWVAIVSVPTLVAGVYGMNFDHMPELHWTYGYPLIVTLTVTVCSLLHRAFKRNGWL